MDTELNRKTLDIKEISEDQPKLLSKENLLAELKLGEKKEINLNPPVTKRTTPCSPVLESPQSKSFGLPIPKTIITKRTRTHSTNERAMRNPVVQGKITYFSRTKGHGFIADEDGGEDIFLHISDIEGEYVPRVGDEVSFRLCPIPPKEEKYQATHVRIINFTPDVHVKWDSPLYEDEKSDCSPTFEN
ncbi:unnamed protein product [Allacma fusca]|uniref:CSD domain-containing protein n=1 Tax=Allacma fusca TaxID=39272 RepID=A0A8J2NM27_9HEXA|nr:unnamed protein product [Allacma fusca]